jgi:hypothetical protein
MRSHGNAIRGHEALIPHLDLETIRAWARSTFTKERIVEAALCAATVSLIGVVGLSLYRAMENYIILGF